MDDEHIVSFIRSTHKSILNMDLDQDPDCNLNKDLRSNHALNLIK